MDCFNAVFWAGVGGNTHQIERHHLPAIPTLVPAQKPLARGRLTRYRSLPIVLSATKLGYDVPHLTLFERHPSDCMPPHRRRSMGAHARFGRADCLSVDNACRLWNSAGLRLTRSPLFPGALCQHRHSCCALIGHSVFVYPQPSAYQIDSRAAILACLVA